VDIDEVDAAPCFIPKMNQLMHITCHGKKIQSSLEVPMFHAARYNSFCKTSNWHIQTNVCCLLNIRTETNDRINW
jgi:hypothetical protein